MVPMFNVASAPVLRARLVAARLAHSAARKAVNAQPIGACPELEQIERAACAAVEAARAAYETKPREALAPVLPMTCCHAAVDVPHTHYMRETNCCMHGNRTIGTCD